jgi:NarL family two-component system response regulator LiaR
MGAWAPGVWRSYLFAGEELVMQEIRVLLVEDHTLFRKGLREIINSQGDMAVVGEAGNGVEAAKMAEELTPDIVLTCIDMPILDGVGATHLITAHDQRVGVIILTMHSERQRVRAAIEAGAKGYILKDAEPEELLRAIRSVHSGEVVIDPSMASDVVFDLLRRGKGQMGSPLPVLSEREKEIMQLVAQGLTNEQIAERLYLSKNTVRNYLGDIYRELQVKNRAEAVAVVVQRGEIKLG